MYTRRRLQSHNLNNKQSMSASMISLFSHQKHSKSHMQQRPLTPPENPKFVLSATFLDAYKTKPVEFGFNGMGALVFARTYSRTKTDGEQEAWWETVQRVVEGCYNIQKRHIETGHRQFDMEKAQGSAQEMYTRIFEMKFTPPGRGLWAMGSTITEERHLYAALNNCAFVSTKDMHKISKIKPFTFLMDMSMLGVGVGFDVIGAEQQQVEVYLPNVVPVRAHTIPDSREGWVFALDTLLASFFYPDMPSVEFDYSDIRPAGIPIKGFGGTSSGPEPLKKLLDKVRELLTMRAILAMERGEKAHLEIVDIMDIMNLIGRCVIAGNVRRTAEIAFGPATGEYMHLKNRKHYPERNDWTEGWGWTSNNSIFADLGMDYTTTATSAAETGEPGFEWLENAREYGRMSEPKDYKDARASGGNPCLEQTLESYELCCLVETFPSKHETLEDYLKTLKYAFLYAKTVTLCQTHWRETNAVMTRNRRIGCSVSGIAQFKGGLHELRKWLTQGYQTIQQFDLLYSQWLGIPRSIKLTSVKPSGTVSLLAGVTPGMHWPLSRYYRRRVRIACTSPYLKPLEKAGYEIEPSVNDSTHTVIVTFPVDLGPNIRPLSEVSMWEQLAMAAFLQAHWADNQVSCTISVKSEEKSQVAHALNYYQYQLKGVSFLPMDSTEYPQMPYEAISAEEYQELKNKITGDISLLLWNQKADEIHREYDSFCDGPSCSYTS